MPLLLLYFRPKLSTSASIAYDLHITIQFITHCSEYKKQNMFFFRRFIHSILANNNAYENCSIDGRAMDSETDEVRMQLMDCRMCDKRLLQLCTCNVMYS